MDEWQQKLTVFGMGLLGFAFLMLIVMVVIDKAPKRGKERYQLAFFVVPAILGGD